MTSTVLFTKITSQNKENNMNKIQQLYKKLSFDNKIKENNKVAIKVNFEEQDETYLYSAKLIVDEIKKINGKPFLTDTNTLYHLNRNKNINNSETSIEDKHYSVVDAPIILADGLDGNNQVNIEINKDIFDIIHIAQDIYESDAIIVMSHVKGHQLTGFSGALKNLAIGCASKDGKIKQHKLIQPLISRTGCLACKDCIKGCPENAINLGSYATIDYDKCTGCNDCLEMCPTYAIRLNFSKSEDFMKGMIEYDYGIIKNKKENNILYINFLTNIIPNSKNCKFSNNPIVPDIGIVASYDPVAIDQASYDLINKEEGNKNSMLKTNFNKGEDKFKGVWHKINGYTQLKTAEKLDIGTRNYKLIEINNN